MTNKPATVEEYLDALAPGRKTAISRLRKVIRRAAPAAVESMRYGIPTYELGGDRFIALASRKRHMSLYFCDTGILEQHRGDLEGLDVGRSCIRFVELDHLPLPLIQQMLRKQVLAAERTAADEDA